MVALLLALIMTIGAVPHEVLAMTEASHVGVSTVADPIIVTIADQEVELPPDGIVAVEVNGQHVEMEIPRFLYVDGERISIDDERFESITPVLTMSSAQLRALSTSAPIPRVPFIVPFSIPSNVEIIPPNADFEFDGGRLWLTTENEGRMEVGARRYFVNINGLLYEAYCANPNLRGPGSTGAAYVMTGNQAEQFRPVLRYGFPHNPHAATLPIGGQSWFLYMTRVAVGLVGNPGATVTNWDEGPISSANESVLQQITTGTYGGAPASLANNPPITVGGPNQSSDHQTGATPQSAPFELGHNRRNNCDRNVFNFVWDTATPAGTRLYVNGAYTTTAPTNPTGNFRTGTAAGIGITAPIVQDIHFVMPAGSEGQTAAVDMVGINNQYAGRVFVMQNDTDSDTWQDIVFYVHEVSARASYTWEGTTVPGLGHLRIVKTDMQGGSLAGAVFTVNGPDPSMPQTITVGADGWTSGPLELGHYTITEITPPPGYTLASNPTQTIVVTENHTSTAPAIVTFANSPTITPGPSPSPSPTPRPNGVTIQKICAITGANIPDAVIHLQGMSAATVTTEDGQIITLNNTGINATQVLTAGATTALPSDVTSTVTNGVWRLDGLPYGFYQVTEIQAPDGFSMQPGPNSFGFWKLPPNVRVDSPDGELYIITYEPNSNHIMVTFRNYPFGRLELLKVEGANGIAGNRPLPGATFRIEGFYPGTPARPLLRYAQTDSQGRIVFEDLPAGNFTVTEVMPPSGYTFGSQRVWSVNIGWGQTASIIAYNVPKSNLTVYKACSNTGTLLDGATFELRDPTTGETWTGTTVNGSTTFGVGSEGNYLYPGRTYILTEVRSPAGYVILSGPWDIVLSPGDNSIRIYNTPYGEIVIYKRDYANGTGSGRLLPGATFRIQGTYLGTNPPTIIDRTAVTDENGRIQMALPGGTFTITEIDPPSGFLLGDAPTWTVTVVPGQTVSAGTAPTHTFFNMEKSSLEVLKICGVTNRVLQGATFELEDPTTGERWEATTNAQGIAVFGRGTYGNFLYPNRVYMLREIIAPTGFVLDSTPREIVLSPGNENRITWTNYENPGLTIIKECQDTGTRLAGAHFTIVAQGSGRPLPIDFPMITDENGEIHIPWTLFANESERNFIVTETVPPPGFHLADPNWQLVTLQAGYDHTVVFSNRRMPTLTIQKTDAVTGDPIQGADFTVERLSPTPAGMITGNPFRTNAQGQIVIPNLPAGVYRIIETRAANNYWLDADIANRTWTITIRENEDYLLQVENIMLPTLIITKMNQVTFRPVPLTRFLVEFEVPGTGNLVRIGEFVTDANGQIILPFVQPGWYRITETHPAPGMSLNVNNSYRVFLSPGQNTYQLLTQMPGLRQSNDEIPEQVTPNNPVNTESDLPSSWGNMPDDARTAVATANLQVTGSDPHLAGENIWNWPLNSIVIKKTCSVTGQLLQGATFEVVHTSAGVSGTLGTVIGRFTTDHSGVIVLTGLIPGSYVVREVIPPNNFTLSVTNTQTVHLMPDGHSVVEVVFDNDPYGSLVISKRCSVTGVPLANAEFRVVNSSGAVVGTANGLFTTNAQGEIVIPNLPPGSYIVTETRAPNGFVLDSTPQTIFIGATGQAYRLEFTNRPLGMLIIRKLDSFDDSPLAGAIFEVRRQDGTLIGEFTTDASGTIEIPGVLGWVIVEETQAPAGHELDPNAVRTVEIQPGAPTVVTFRNPRQGSLTITKTDGDGNPLAGAVFRVTRQNGELIGTFTTPASGVVNIPNLQSGWYVVEEIQAPPGFVRSQAGQTIEVRPNDAAQVTFINHRMPGLIIEKVDDAGNPLAGAEFEVRTLGGNLVARVTSNSGGIATVEAIEPGSYLVTETRAPQGFVRDSNAQPVEVRAGETATLRFTNTPYAETSIRKISGDDGRPLAGVVFEITRLNGERVQNPANRTFEFVTDTSGMIHIPGLPAGTYVATEIRALPGYTLAEPVTFVVVNGRDTVITIRNYKMPSVVVRKICGETGRPLPGVVFEIARYLQNGRTGQRLKNYALDNSYEFTTDASGHIYLPTLEDGQWVAIETRPLPGYMAASPRVFTVGINGDTTIIIRNYRYPDFSILKLDGATRQPLTGVHFEIAHDIGNGTAGQRLVNPADGTTTFVTDTAGRIPLPGITPGRYIAIETRALPGYTIEGPVLFTVAPGENRTITIYNHKRADWVIRKTDGDTGRPLEGVQFEIAHYFGNGNAGERLQNPIDGSTRFYTNEAGLIHLPNLQPGTFIAIETRALPGYVLAEPVIFVVSADAQNTTINIDNFRIPGLIIRKINSVTRQPIEGVIFQIARPNGERIQNPQTGFFDFVTNRDGLIHLPELPDGTYLVTETRPAEGYFGLDEPILVEVNSATRRQDYLLVVENTPASGLLIIKRDAHTRQPLQGVEFDIRHADGRRVTGLIADQNQPGTHANSPNLGPNGGFLTDHRGRIIINHLPSGVFHITEVAALPGYILDTTVHVVTITPGRLSTLEVYNVQMAGLRINKICSVSRQPIYGVEFRIFDFNTNQEVAGPFYTDNNGVIYFRGILPHGRYIIRETREAPGFIRDAMPRTIEFRAGMITEITWENTPIAGQIQITKLSSADNEVNGLPRGSRLEGAVFEVRDWRTGNVVDQFRTVANGVGASRPLPLGRYTVHEIQAPPFYRRSDVVLDITIEHSGQIVRYNFYNEPANIGVDIRKIGPEEVMPGQRITWNVTTVANSSTVELNSFFWRDVLPTDAVRLDRVFTGTFNQSVRYSVLFRTNRHPDLRVAYDNLLSTTNHGLTMSQTALGLQSGEFVTEIMFQFGTVRAGFRSVDAPRIEAIVLDGLQNGMEFVNRVYVGGMHGGEWVIGNHRWITRVFRPQTGTLPRTGR